MIEYRKSTRKFILSQGKIAALRLFRAIERLPNGDVKRLRGQKEPPLFRLRVGDYRVVFSVNQDTFLILRVDNRGDVYK